MVRDQISVTQFLASDGVADWRFVAGGAATFFATDSFGTGVRLAHAIGAVDESAEDQHLDVDLRRDGVAVRVITLVPRVYCGLTTSDLELARRISVAAAGLGLSADPSRVQSVQISIDALDRAAVAPFWQALLGYIERDGPDDLIDPQASAPPFYFAELDAPRPQRNTVHVDVYVPADQARPRVERALAAGGHLVTDEFAPAWWVLADPEGNEAMCGSHRSRADRRE